MLCVDVNITNETFLEIQHLTYLLIKSSEYFFFEQSDSRSHGGSMLEPIPTMRIYQEDGTHKMECMYSHSHPCVVPVQCGKQFLVP